jgi:hypothetical protein
MVLRKSKGRQFLPESGFVRKQQTKESNKYNILAVRYRHDVMRHQIYFGAIVALTRLALEEEPLFSVDY